MQFRPDIEGLRALAILLVVAAHAGIPWLTGGYIGVDIFFVLSGYLITRLLAEELTSTGTIQFAVFYARRFRRLLPALLLMLGSTMLLGAQLLPITQQSEQANAAATASIWGSNFFFACSRLDYFGTDSSQNLFLHTWSLGVEEQFYLVWPLLLLASCGAWRKSASPNLKSMAQTLCLVAGISLTACLYLTSVEPRHAFYLMPSRAWQFALGGLVSLYVADRINFKAAAIPFNFISWLGLGLIIATSILLSQNVSYPGAWALLPTVGTAAVLASGTQAPQLTSIRILSHPFLTAIGRISYSWYLWHWPILLLGTLLWPSASLALRLTFVVASLLPAWLSLRYIEDPIRRNQHILQPPYRAILGAFLLMACAIAGTLQWQISVTQNLNSPLYLQVQKARTDLPSLYSMGCDQWYYSAELKPCEFGNPSAPKTVILIGDSIGVQWFPAMERIFDTKQWRIIVMTKSACPIVDEPIFYPRIGREYTECAHWRDAALDRISEIAPASVILGSTQTYEYSSSQWRDGTDRVLRKIAPAVGTISLIKGTPMLPFNGPDCIAPRGWLWNVLAKFNCMSRAKDTQSDTVAKALQEAASHYPNVKVVDMTAAICPNGICSAMHDGMPTYRDNRHLSARFVSSLAPDLAKAMHP